MMKTILPTTLALAFAMGNLCNATNANKSPMMSLRKKIIVAVLSVSGLVGLVLLTLFFLWYNIDDTYTGLKEGVALSAADDCPFELPAGATDIHYAYELFWQGGCSIGRYKFPAGDLRTQAAKHLRTPAPWEEISATVAATVPEHQFSSHGWFQPASINGGWESDTSGILWEPKVWIDEEKRLIYVIEQN